MNGAIREGPLVSLLLSLGLAVAVVAAGCQPRQPAPPAPRADVPPRPSEPPPMRERDPIKPLPEEPVVSDLPPPPFNDVPLVNQRPPEQKAYLDAYEAVGRPRMVVFVNRTLEGDLVPKLPGSAPRDPFDSRRDSASSGSRDLRSRDGTTRGGDAFLRPGEYDEVDARAIDYESMENILMDWLAADGRVEVISPTMARQRLTDQQVADLQQGRPQAMGEVARQLDTDVLVQVQARPTRQTPQGLQVRIVAEAINVRGGQSIGRGVVDVPPPLDKPQLNKYTRFLARRLMDGMSSSWRAAASDRGREREQDRDAERRLRERAADPNRDDRDLTTRPPDDRPLDTRRADPRRDETDRTLVEPAPATRAAPTTRPSSEPDAPAGAPDLK